MILDFAGSRLRGSWDFLGPGLRGSWDFSRLVVLDTSRDAVLACAVCFMAPVILLLLESRCVVCRWRVKDGMRLDFQNKEIYKEIRKIGSGAEE